MIQFAVMLRSKCSANLYDLFRKVFNLPPNQTLCEYLSNDSMSPDGVMVQTIIHMSKLFERLKIPIGDWRRHFNLGWDSHVVKDMLGFCPHAKRLLGYAHDAFNLYVIAREFKRRYTDTKAAEMAGDVETEEDKDEDDEPNKTSNNTDDDNKLQLGKHYMVFMAQSIAAEHRPFCFMVARYCLSSLTSRWVRVNKRQITSAMAFHDFIVLLDYFDGAPEN